MRILRGPPCRDLVGHLQSSREEEHIGLASRDDHLEQRLVEEEGEHLGLESRECGSALELVHTTRST